MKKITEVQLKSELKTIDSEISKLEYHLVGLKSEKEKTIQWLEELNNRKRKIKSYL